MGGVGPTQLLIVLAVLVLLFGAKKLPDLARSVGRSTRILKAELGGDEAAGGSGRAEIGRAEPRDGSGPERTPETGRGQSNVDQ